MKRRLASWCINNLIATVAIMVVFAVAVAILFVPAMYRLQFVHALQIMG